MIDNATDQIKSGVTSYADAMVDGLVTNFNVTALTSSFTTNFIASYYKIFQPTNFHWFNYSDALQSVSSTDLYTLPNFTSTSVNNIFQRDLNSLHNFSSLFFQLR